jgi:hypothetical protein
MKQLTFFMDVLRKDIMLVQLRTPSLAPLQQINFDATFPAVGSDATVIGYGVTSFPGGSTSSVLMEVSLPVVSYSECDGYYNTIVDPIEICTGKCGARQVQEVAIRKDV